MPTKTAAAIGLAVALTAVLAGCGGAAPEPPAPAKVMQIAGSSVPRVQLTGPAAERLGVTTQAVRETSVTAAGTTAVHKVIPYAAVVYDTDGSTWAYVSTAVRTYVRSRITILAIQGSTAVLHDGPAVGAPVVTVGAPELLGTEYNISGEE